MSENPGYFISFEGGEGSGKTTQIKLLASWIDELAPGSEVLVTREPGGTPTAEDIRALLVTGSPEKWRPATEAMLMSASRHEHVEQVIKPALAAGKLVISDRFYDSTRVYQGLVGGVDKNAIDALNHLACGDLVPDITFLLDMDGDVGLGRADGRGGVETRFENKGSSFHSAVRAGFLELASEEPERFVVLDASESVDAIAASIRAVLTDRLGIGG